MDLIPNKKMADEKKHAVEKYFNEEAKFMAAQGYLESKESNLRRKAVRVIADNSRSQDFDPRQQLDPYIAYLAMNYFDRFISRHQLPVVKGQVRNDVVLLALSCLTLAWKTRIKAFVLDDFLNGRNFQEFTKLDIWKMEYHVIEGLERQMRPPMALSFVEYLADKLPLKQGFRRSKINEIIIQAQGDITFTQFKPSVIAASALLALCTVLYPDQYHTCKQILLSDYIKEEELDPCMERTIAMCKEKEIALESGDKQLEFELKWVANESEDLTIDSPVFRSNVSPALDPIIDRNELAADPNVDPDWLLCSEDLTDIF